jgi:hypothetical protein
MSVIGDRRHPTVRPHRPFPVYFGHWRSDEMSHLAANMACRHPTDLRIAKSPKTSEVSCAYNTHAEHELRYAASSCLAASRFPMAMTSK